MKMPFPSLPGLACVLLAAATTGAQAAPRDAVEDCVDLAPQHQIVRSGGSTHFLVKSGNDHYKVAFQRSCSSLHTASRVTIATDGREGRLCPGTGTVETQRERCVVGTVSRVEPEEFSRQQRRRR